MRGITCPRFVINGGIHQKKFVVHFQTARVTPRTAADSFAADDDVSRRAGCHQPGCGAEESPAKETRDHARVFILCCALD